MCAQHVNCNILRRLVLRLRKLSCFIGVLETNFYKLIRAIECGVVRYEAFCGRVARPRSFWGRQRLILVGCGAAMREICEIIEKVIAGTYFNKRALSTQCILYLHI